MEKNLIISYCGIVCSLCPAYRSGDCPSCLKLEECKIVQCARSKNIRFCFLCKDFPCKLFEKGFDWNLDEIPNLRKFKLGVVKWKPFSKEYIMLFKLKKKNK